MTEWKYWTPERDGHAPDDWDGAKVEFKGGEVLYWRPLRAPSWHTWCEYRYHAKTCLQDAKYEPDLLAQCLALPQDQREALIEAMQKPQRDWADDVADQLCCIVNGDWSERAAAVIRSMCRPNDGSVEALQHALVDHNERLRSTQQIAFREGNDTNWQSFRGQCTYTLAEHQETVNHARAALATVAKRS